MAIKVLPAERTVDQDRRRRFIQEARAASALDHPNIVTIHEIESAEGMDFIVMELVAGRTLDTLIPPRGMKPDEVVRVGIPIADSLARAHAAGMILPPRSEADQRDGEQDGRGQGPGLRAGQAGKATAVGAATGIVVGLVAITPAAGFIGPRAALVLGMVAAFPSYYALVYRARTRLDDSLDVVAAHGLGGTVGALLTGVFASKAWNGTVDGLLHGNGGQLGIQAVGVLASIVYSGVATYVLFKVIGLVIPLKVDKRDEGLGLDVSQHGEEAYADGEGAILILQRTEADAPAAVPALAAAAAEGGRS